jgi:hypothetical protein
MFHNLYKIIEKNTFIQIKILLLYHYKNKENNYEEKNIFYQSSLKFKKPSEDLKLVSLFCGKNGNYFSCKINRIKNPAQHQTMVS